MKSMAISRMDRSYWDRLAPTYDEEVLSSFDADLLGIIGQRLDEISGPKKTVLDLGCGVGKYLQPLSERFGRVWGVDHSADLLDIAAHDHGHLSNVELQVANVSDEHSLPGIRADVVVCANVLIMADGLLRASILRTAKKAMARDGRLVLVVPSLESALMAHRRLVQWYERDGATDPETAAEEDAFSPSKSACRELLRGVVRIDGVPTKHYLREELRLTLRDGGLKVLHLDRVSYAWDSEFGDAPKWMREPFPWDWLVVARRN